MSFENRFLAGTDKSVILSGDHQTKLDYQSRTDGNPVYVGVAERGITTTQEQWLIAKITYDTSGNPTVIQHTEGAWDSRTTLPYA